VSGATGGTGAVVAPAIVTAIATGIVGGFGIGTVIPSARARRRIVARR
jgi:hypothetical protein